MEAVTLIAVAAAVVCAEAYAAHAARSAATRTAAAVQALAEAAERAAATAAERADHEGGTDPALVERIEAAERRVEAVADDVNRRYRKLAQERRRIDRSFQAADPDEDDDELPILGELFGRAEKAGPQRDHPNGGRRRLRRR